MRYGGCAHSTRRLPMTLKQCLVRQHALALRRVIAWVFASTSGPKGRIIIASLKNVKSDSLSSPFYRRLTSAWLLRTDTTTRHGSGSRIVFVSTRVGSTRCLHIISFTLPYHTAWHSSLHNTQTIRTTRMTVTYGRRRVI